MSSYNQVDIEESEVKERRKLYNRRRKRQVRFILANTLLQVEYK